MAALDPEVPVFDAGPAAATPKGITAWVFVPLLMLVAGIMAAWIPARRAARVDPYNGLEGAVGTTTDPCLTPTAGSRV